MLGEILDVVGEIQQIEPGNADKPVAIVENAASEVGGNKPDWIREALGTFLPDHHEIAAYSGSTGISKRTACARTGRSRARRPLSKPSAPRSRAASSARPRRLPNWTKVPPPPAPIGWERLAVRRSLDARPRSAGATARRGSRRQEYVSSGAREDDGTFHRLRAAASPPTAPGPRPNGSRRSARTRSTRRSRSTPRATRPWSGSAGTARTSSSRPAGSPPTAPSVRPRPSR